MTTQQRWPSGDWRYGNAERAKEDKLANGLGWFSIGLGLAEVTAPRKMAQLIGVNDAGKTRNVLRSYGIREIAAGVGILTRPRPASWVWGRVAGDVLDLTSLGSALASRGVNRTRIAIATAAVAGVTALDVCCGKELSRNPGHATSASKQPVYTRKSIIVNRPTEEVYQFWRDFSNLPTFMAHLHSVEESGEGRSHWKMKTVGGKTVEWDAEMVADEPNSRISWRSVAGSDVSHSGSVRFQPATGGRGTVVRVELTYDPPGGAIAANIAKLFRAEPGQQIEEDLRAFKQVMETGEIAKSDASIHRGMHAAQPPLTA